MTPAPNWPEALARLSQVKAALERADRKKIYRHLPANPPASETDLVAAEQAIGEPLDPQYRELLSHAGGWPAVLQSVDLFGPADFLGSPVYLEAKQALGWLAEENMLEPIGFTASELLPIAMSVHDRDLFVMARRASNLPGTVVWLAGYEIERYPDFASFFEALIEHNHGALAIAEKNAR